MLIYIIHNLKKLKNKMKEREWDIMLILFYINLRSYDKILQKIEKYDKLG